MTPTEIIAVRLFGWVKDNRPLPPNVERGYMLPGTVHRCSVTCNQSVASFSYWPDLTDWNWIRRMEDALREQGLYEGPPSKPSYVRELRRIVGLDVSDYYVATFATAAQRVEAAVKVLEGQQ